MSFYFKPFSMIAFCVGMMLFAACGQNAADQPQTLQTYTAQKGQAQLLGNIANAGQLSFNLMQDGQQEPVLSFVAQDGSFDVKLETIPVNEIYFLEIKGIAQGFSDGSVEWREAIPVFIKDGATLTLVATPYDGYDSLSKLRFRIDGAGDEQDFLQEWNEALLQKRSELDGEVTVQMNASGAMTSRNTQSLYEEAFNKINRDFIDKGQPLVSTLYLISKENDHRSKLDFYQGIYDQASPEVQQSKYGVDLSNRIFRITDHQPAIDLDEVLAARNSQLLPYNPETFTGQKYLILSFWASWEPGIKETLTELENIIPDSRKEEIAVLYFSLDTKMSEWKPVTDELALTNSFMLRAEVRQTAIDQLYLTELPRYMIVQPDGTIIENDVPFDRLPEVISGL